MSQEPCQQKPPPDLVCELKSLDVFFRKEHRKIKIARSKELALNLSYGLVVVSAVCLTGYLLFKRKSR